MSKYSISENRAQKLEESLLQDLEQTIAMKDDLNAEEIAALPSDDFVLVPYNAEAAERAGYSN